MANNVSIHPASTIGQAQAAVKEQQGVSAKVEARIDALAAPLAALERALTDDLTVDADVDVVAEQLSRKAALDWLTDRLRERLTAARAEEARLKRQVGTLCQTAIKTEELVEELAAPGLGWSEETKDLCRVCYNVRLHWLRGDPADDETQIERAQAARQAYSELHNVISRTRREELRQLEQEMRARGV